jgi:hypothetical protein
MDIRQIQALHAQYSQQPVIIDIAGHAAAMPALPAPESATSQRWGLNGLRTKLKAASRPVLLCVTIAALAGGGGISAAKIWRVLHERGAVADAPAANAGGAVARTAVADEATINAAPSRPLTTSDFGAQPSPPSALASIDARSLEMNAQRVAPVTQKPEANAALAPLAAAAAAPIRALRSAPPAQPGVAMAALPAAQPATVASMAAPAPASSATAGSTSPAASAPGQRPALRPLRHVPSHRTSQSPEESAAPAQPQPKPATVKGGDVQLF